MISTLLSKWANRCKLTHQYKGGYIKNNEQQTKSSKNKNLRYVERDRHEGVEDDDVRPELQETDIVWIQIARTHKVEKVLEWVV